METHTRVPEVKRKQYYNHDDLDESAKGRAGYQTHAENVVVRDCKSDLSAATIMSLTQTAQHIYSDSS